MPGVVVRKQVAKTRADVQDMIRKTKIKSLPAMDVPGKMVRGVRQREILTDPVEIEEFCKETVRQAYSDGRKRR